MSRKIPYKIPYRPKTHTRCKICLSPYKEEIEHLWAIGTDYAEICRYFPQLQLRKNNISRHMIFSGLNRDLKSRASYILEEQIRIGLEKLDTKQVTVRDMLKACRILAGL